MKNLNETQLEGLTIEQLEERIEFSVALPTDNESASLASSGCTHVIKCGIGLDF
ncbi:hypothetical protein SL054_000574 [Flavobacterium psychrophilum]|uniref:hypothetical protein n=1 Tax=Flavobacterium psychrophilum TaxID=96345 RepID=UPI000B7C0FCD|nr:hypothetical protein [Flavobacterium psychrophilum]ELY1978648.1 hypothetical protein [Flavobacterium psychrophilum]ELY1991254.1 hypothetical protein [Flavobacterium psychrophilum]SNB37445.1 hypothetical protein NO098_350082 [Flavobacterium psychrophilum]